MTDKKRVGLVPSIQARLKSRPTKDIDFLAQNIPNDAKRLKILFTDPLSR